MQKTALENICSHEDNSMSPFLYSAPACCFFTPSLLVTSTLFATRTLSSRLLHLESSRVVV